MRILWYILESIVGLAALLGLTGFLLWTFKYKQIWDKIKFTNYSFSSADLEKLSLSDIPAILSGGQKQINVDFGVDVVNDSDTDIKFGNIKADLSYKGQKIAETSSALEQQSFNVPAHSSRPISDTLTLTLGQNVGQILIDKLQGKPVNIDLNLKLSALGIPRMLIPAFNVSFPWK